MRRSLAPLVLICLLSSVGLLTPGCATLRAQAAQAGQPPAPDCNPDESESCCMASGACCTMKRTCGGTPTCECAGHDTPAPFSSSLPSNASGL